MTTTSLAQQPSGDSRSSSAGVGQFTWDLVNDTWWWSEALFRLLGYEPGAAVASLGRFLQHKDPRDRARVDAVFSRCLNEGGPFSCYHHIIDTRGVCKTVVAVGHGDRDAADTRTTAIHGYLVDVTASGRHDTNTALQAALVNRAAIEQVKGILMLVYGLDADAAFQLLVGHSQISNTKLSVIVSAIIGQIENRAASETINRAEIDAILRTACLNLNG